MFRNEAVCEVQAKAVSLDACRRRRAIAATEDLRQFGLIETDAFVGDADRRDLLIGGHRDRDRRALGRVFQGVREEIHQDLADPSLVPLPLGSRVCGHVDLMESGHANFFRHLARESGEVHRPW